VIGIHRQNPDRQTALRSVELVQIVFCPMGRLGATNQSHHLKDSGPMRRPVGEQGLARPRTNTIGAYEQVSGNPLAGTQHGSRRMTLFIKLQGRKSGIKPNRIVYFRSMDQGANQLASTDAA
jgi:hypothetical protein